MKGESNVAMDCSLTPWYRHLLKSFVNDHQSTPPKGKDFTSHHSNEGQQGRVSTRGVKRGRVLQTDQTPKGRLDWSDHLESEEADGSNTSRVERLVLSKCRVP